MIKDINPNGNIEDWCPAPKGITPESRLKAKLKGARAVAGLSQAELGKQLEVMQQTVSYWEITGNIPAVMLGPLSDSLGVEMEFWRV